MNGQSDFVTSYMDPSWAWGLGGAREQALSKFLKFQHCNPVQDLQLPSWLFMTMRLSTPRPLCIATTLPPVTIICFEIWNLVMMVSAIHDDEWLMPLSFDAGNQFYLMLWRHKLQWRHIRNRLIRVRKGCTFHWCIDCGKYCCLICRGRKLFGWFS